MTKRQVNQLRMLRTVRDFLDKYMKSLASAPMFIALLSKFDTLLDSIEAAADYQQNGAKGKMEAQRSAQNYMISMLQIVGGVLHAYARSIQSSELMTKTRMKRGALERMRLADSLRIAEHIYEAADAVKERLAEYWVNGKDVLGEFRLSIDTANNALGARYQSVVNRSTMRKHLGMLFREADDFLTSELDNFLEQFLQSNPEALANYMNARQTRWYGMRRWWRSKPLPNSEESATTPAPNPSQSAAISAPTLVQSYGGNGALPENATLLAQREESPMA